MLQRPSHNPENHEPPSVAHVAVTWLLVCAAGLLLALFAIPNSSPWFWPLVGVLVVVGVVALLIRLPSRDTKQD